MTPRSPLLLLLLAMLTNPSVAQDKNRFRFPDEWDAHEATILIFPARHSYGRKAAALQRESAALANALAEHEEVIVFAHSGDANRARQLLDEDVDLKIGKAYTIDWARDNAPLFVRNKKGERKAVCFQFNGWGKKYEGWQDDRGVAKAIAKALEFEIVDSKLVLEGGAIEIGMTNKGLTGITTEQCVLNKNRTSWSKARVEKELKEKLGLDRVIWLPKGLNPDPITDGHVDGLLKFVAKNRVMLHSVDDPKDENYETCRQAKKLLRAAGLEVIDLPLADDIVHMNFYIGSGGKIAYVPVCGDPEQDAPALRVIKKHFKKVVPIRAVAMGEAGGGVHCYTQQLPKGTDN